VQACSTCRDRRDDRTAEDLAQTLDVHLDAPGLGLVHHVQGHDDGQAHVQDLEPEVQIARQVGGVQDQDGDVWGAVQQGLAGDPLILRDAAQRVGARQVNDPDGTILEAGLAQLHLDRLAGIVGRDDAHSRQPVEETRLADVGIPGQCDGELDVLA
jgi:hypothetical protein